MTPSFLSTYAFLLSVIYQCRSSDDSSRTSLSPSFTSCDVRGGWNFRDESCYYVVKASPREWRPYAKIQFADYQQACAKINATLPVIGSEEEQEFLRAHTKYGDGLFNAFDYYLGIRSSSAKNQSNSDQKSMWHWIDGTLASNGYKPPEWHFDPSYPCVSLGWTGWRNELCWHWDSRDLYAVCELPYDPTCKENQGATGC